MRAVVPWRFEAPLTSLHHDIDDLFARFFGEEERRPARRAEGAFLPALETFVKDGELVLRADLPGIDPKDVDLSVEDGQLLIKGERKSVHEDKDRVYREVAYGRFERSLTLPRGVDTESIKASYKDGVLEIRMKAPKELEPKKVPVTIQ